jgi:AbrB family looped-hinge helix DNA binding protein
MDFGHGRHGRHGASGESGGQYFGTTTIGERGQIVIPKEARESFGLKPGDKLLVLGHQERGGLALVKADVMEQFVSMFLGGKLGGAQAEPEDDDTSGGDASGPAAGADEGGEGGAEGDPLS